MRSLPGLWVIGRFSSERGLDEFCRERKIPGEYRKKGEIRVRIVPGIDRVSGIVRCILCLAENGGCSITMSVNDVVTDFSRVDARTINRCLISGADPGDKKSRFLISAIFFVSPARPVRISPTITGLFLRFEKLMVTYEPTRPINGHGLEQPEFRDLPPDLQERMRTSPQVSNARQ